MKTAQYFPEMFQNGAKPAFLKALHNKTYKTIKIAVKY